MTDRWHHLVLLSYAVSGVIIKPIASFTLVGSSGHLAHLVPDIHVYNIHTHTYIHTHIYIYIYIYTIYILYIYILYYILYKYIYIYIYTIYIYIIIYIEEQAPEYLQVFERVNEPHHYNTRHSVNALIIPKGGSYGMKSFHYIGAKIWNSLPDRRSRPRPVNLFLK